MKVKSSGLAGKNILIVVIAAIVIVGAFLLTYYLKTERQSFELAWNSGELTKVTLPEPQPEAESPTTTSKPTSSSGGVCANEMTYVEGILIVNKKHCLSADYNPGENPEAVANLRNLIAAGQAAGLDLIYSWSGFRSYNTQVSLYNSYVRQDGVALADTYSARPGFSEHQTGLTFDLKDSSGDLYRIGDSTYDPATDWVALHAHEYGFIVRYFNATQSITGYTGEPWHLRYLGVGVATQVYQSGLTLEEYLGVSGGDYAN
jgi:D-alanyl-D-alanine carboxypeptidase